MHLVKLRKRALKFLAHFSLVCLGKCPKAYEKWSQMEKLIWGYIFHPSGMLWRPFGGRFLQVLRPKGVFSSHLLLLQIVKTPSRCKWVANATGRGFDNLCLNSKCNGKGFSKKFLLEIFEILYHVSKSLWFFFEILCPILKVYEIFEILYPVLKFCETFVPCFEILWNFCNSIPCFQIL